MNRPDENDELIRRYREASAQDERRPSAHVREAVRAHAKLVAPTLVGSRAFGDALPLASEQGAELARGGPSLRSSRIAVAVDIPAANQSRWKLSLLASVALAGLTGLLVLQFDRGTPDEQEAALGRPAPPVVSPSPTPPPPAVTDAKEPRNAATAARPATPSPADATVARPAPGRTAPARSVPQQAAPAPAPAPAPVPVPAPVREHTGDAAREQPGEKTERSPETQAMARSAAAPALRAPAAALSQNPPDAQSPPGATALAAALHRAARAGQVAEAEALLQQGAALNAPDGAGRTALALAVIHGHGELVRRLLALGANTALPDREGLDALQHARRLGRDDLVRLIESRR